MKMINIAAVLMLFASTALFANQNSFVPDQEHHLVLEAPKGGPGPLCFPGIGCPSGAKGGPGPMCIPDIGCWPGLMS